MIVFFFFFSSRRRHTRSKRDWSSDVCSSDLFSLATAVVAGPMVTASSRRGSRSASLSRSEERRVGKECRSRWEPNHYKKKKKIENCKKYQRTLKNELDNIMM